MNIKAEHFESFNDVLGSNEFIGILLNFRNYQEQNSVFK